MVSTHGPRVQGASHALVRRLAGVTALRLRPRRRGPARIALYLEGVARAADGSLTAVPPGTHYLPDSRVVDPAAADVAAADRAWLAAGTVPGRGGPFEDMVRGALLDLRALTLADGALLAGLHPRWRLVWPRDASFGAAALAAAGQGADAARILGRLQRLQAPEGSFEARYTPDGGVPDARAPQSDGAGWVLWAAAALLESLPATARPSAAAALAPLARRARAFVLHQRATTTGLPRVSSDYWEVRETRLTLGTAAPLLAGLEAADRIARVLGDRADTEPTARLREAVTRHFGPGYPRHLGGRLADAATAFLLPPYQPEPLPGAVAAWERSIPLMLRPAGGLAPGAGWRQDGISWTPQTALYALAAARLGDVERAQQWLTWLDAHRTRVGALPEKVLADGSPAAVAPLAWTCALVVLAAAALDESRGTDEDSGSDEGRGTGAVRG